ncbi:UNVERIFIED_ORG: helix-turn-helix domain-containing protein [Shinella sp. XGS7]|nr:helix-turn-helix transcriptional regulator [Shinella sp. XGS7]
MVPEALKKRRQDRLTQLLGEHQNKQTLLAAALGKNVSQVNHWLSGHKPISEQSALHIERKLGKPVGWLSANEDGSTPDLPGGTPQTWPLPGISPQQLLALDRTDLDLIAGQVRLLLRNLTAHHEDRTIWREAALAVAADADLKIAKELGTGKKPTLRAGTFTQFCLAVDEHVAKRNTAKHAAGPETQRSKAGSTDAH